MVWGPMTYYGGSTCDAAYAIDRFSYGGSGEAINVKQLLEAISATESTINQAHCCVGLSSW